MGIWGAEHVVRDDVEQSALSGVFRRSENATSGGWGLVRIDQRYARTSHALHDGVIVGSSVNVGLRLDGPGMFPQHARFVVRPDGVYVERAADKAALWVDGVCTMRMPVSNGCVVRMGDTLFVFVERDLSSRRGAIEDHGGLAFGPSQLQWISRAVAYAQARQSFVIDGEPGTGKSSLARLALARGRIEEDVVVDARDADVVRQVRSAIRRGAKSWLVYHLDALARPLQQQLARQLRREPAALLIATLGRSLESALDDSRIASSIASIICARRISVPSLTDRKDDLPAISQNLMTQIGCSDLPLAAIEIIARTRWANGIPELRSVLIQAFGQAECDTDTSVRCLAKLAPRAITGQPLDTCLADADLAKSRLKKALEQADRTVASASRTLQMSRQTFYREAKRLHVDLSRAKAAS